MRRAEKATKRDLSKVRQDMLALPVVSRPSLPLARPTKHADEWDLLPPLSDIIEAVHLFTQKYFQLGFIPKDLFPRQLEENHRSVSVFLLLGILSISARFSARLAERYDGEINAAAFFMERANVLALSELYQEPTLERCQAFYLLSLAQQGSGMRNMSYVSRDVFLWRVCYSLPADQPGYRHSHGRVDASPSGRVLQSLWPEQGKHYPPGIGSADLGKSPARRQFNLMVPCG